MSDEFGDQMDRGADVIVLPSSMGYRANEFQALLDENPIRPVSWMEQGRSCRHYRSWIDKQARRIYCRDCKAELDPYVVLDKIAHAREQLIATARHLRLDIEHRQAELERATRAEKNAKARLSSVRKKLRAHGLDRKKIAAIERGVKEPKTELAERAVLEDGIAF